MKSIKTYLIILSTAFMFVGCKKLTGVDLSGTYTIKQEQNLSIPKFSNQATLIALEFADSRCPINANCVWSGIGTLKIKFKDKAKEQTLELCIGACEVPSKPKKQDIILNGLTYTLELTDMSPYPAMDNKTQTNEATIVLKRK